MLTLCSFWKCIVGCKFFPLPFATMCGTNWIDVNSICCRSVGAISKGLGPWKRERLCAMTFAASAAGAQAELGGKGARGSCHPQSAAIGRRGREEEEEVRFLFSLLPPLHAPSFLLFSFASPLPVLVRYCCVPFLPVSCPSSDWPMATPTHPLPPLFFYLLSSSLQCIDVSLFFSFDIYFFSPTWFLLPPSSLHGRRVRPGGCRV